MLRKVNSTVFPFDVETSLLGHYGRRMPGCWGHFQRPWLRGSSSACALSCPHASCDWQLRSPLMPPPWLLWSTAALWPCKILLVSNASARLISNPLLNDCIWLASTLYEVLRHADLYLLPWPVIRASPVSCLSDIRFCPYKYYGIP